MRSILISEYQATVAMADIPTELKHALKTNERVPAFINNLERELIAVPHKFRTELTIRNTVHDLTNVFLNSIQRKANEDALTTAAKQALKDKASKAAKQESIVNDMIQGKEIDAERILEVTDHG